MNNSRTIIDNLDGTGDREYLEYDMPVARTDYGADYWPAITSYAGEPPVVCPVPGCGQHICWYEAGYVPGYRVCMRPLDGGGEGSYDLDSIRHHFLGQGHAGAPTLVLMDTEDDA